MQVRLIAPEGLPRIRPGDDLARLITPLGLEDGDVVVVAQKIVSKAEGRLVRLADIEPSARALELAAITRKDARYVELVLRESREVLRARPGVLIVEDCRGFVMANAGIDQSNVDGGDSALLLPADPDASAARLRHALREQAGVTVGVVINDSWGRAWRLGTIGTAIGVAGLPGLLDQRGAPDLDGRALRITEIGLADEIAAAGSLLMGQSAEGRPVVIVRGLALGTMREDGSGRELLRDPTLDLFR